MGIDECEFHYLTESGIMLSNKSRPIKLPRKVKKREKRLAGFMIKKAIRQLKPGQDLIIKTPNGEIRISRDKFNNGR